MTNLRVAISRSVEAQPRYTGWRVLHKQEGGYQENPAGKPAVRPCADAEPVEMTRDIQLMSYALHEGRITKDKWRALYGSGTMLTNNQSWPEQVCRDYVNSLDLTAPALPKLMKAIICAGMFIRGRVEGDWLVCEPGISAVDATKPIPDAATVKRNNWYFECVTSGDRIFNILGSPVPLLAPYVLAKPVKYPLEWFSVWNETYLPDAKTVYG